MIKNLGIMTSEGITQVGIAVDTANKPTAAVLTLSSDGIGVTAGSDNATLGANLVTNGSFNGSDARLKTAIAPLTANEINAAKQLSKEIGTYQWLESVQKKGDAARHHVGFTVQRAIEILQLNGCDPFSYGFIGYDKWEDVFVEHAEILPVAAVEPKDAVLDADGNILEPAIAAVEAVEGKAAWTEHKTVAGDAYSFRYDQLNMFIAAGLEARLTALEALL